MHEIDDGLRSRPARRRAAEQRPGDGRQLVRVAVAAAEQERQHVVGQILNRVLAGVRDDRIGLAGVPDHEVRRHGDAPAGRDDAGADVAESVRELPRGHGRIEGDHVWGQKVRDALGTNVEQKVHRRGAEGVESNGVAGANVHERAVDQGILKHNIRTFGRFHGKATTKCLNAEQKSSIYDLASWLDCSGGSSYIWTILIRLARPAATRTASRYSLKISCAPSCRM